MAKSIQSRWWWLFLCAGFTTYGTATAAEHLFSVVLSEHTGIRGLAARYKSKDACFVEVITARYSGGVAYASERVPGGYATFSDPKEWLDGIEVAPVDAATAKPGCLPLTMPWMN